MPLVVRVDEDLAEPARERLVLLGVELLVAEEHDAVLVAAPRGSRRSSPSSRSSPIVDAVDLGAARAGDRTHLDAAVAHRSCSLKDSVGRCCRSRPDASGQDAWPSDFIDLVYRSRPVSSWPGGSARAACGRGGVRPDKREGDGASPREGTFPLIAAYYRPDRIAPPLRTGLKLTALCPGAWLDR